MWFASIPRIVRHAVRQVPYPITGMNFLNGAAPALDETATSRDEQGLPQRMDMPRRSRTWLEGDAGTTRAGWFSGAE